MKWWVIELHNYIMNDSSEAHNLGQILQLLHLAPVTFRTGFLWQIASGFIHISDPPKSNTFHLIYATDTLMI